MSEVIPAEKKIPTKFTTSQQVVLNGTAQAAQRKDNNIPAAKDDEGQQQQQQNNDAPPELTDDQLKAFFKSKNINFEGDLNAIKERLEYTPPQAAQAAAAAQPTPEELAAKEIAKEKRMLDLWTDNGGKPEEFYNLKKLVSADDKELSMQEIKRELKAEGFDDDEISDVIAERYYQIDPESLEQKEDESDADFTKRKERLSKQVKYGAKKLANRSTNIKTQAGKILEGFARQVEQQDLDRQGEETFAKNVDEHFKTLPKETVVELGEIAKGFTVDPIKHPYSEAAVQKAMNLLKNTEERNNFFQTKDGSLNLPNLAQLLVSHFEQQEIYKSIYVDATTRQTEEFRKKFPHTSAQGLGVGSAPQKSAKPNTTPTKAGVPTRV